MSGGTAPGISDGTADRLPPGWKKGLAGAQCVPSLEEAAVLMEELRGLPEFLFGYVASGAKPKVIVFLDAETYEDKRPKGMVEMLILGSLAQYGNPGSLVGIPMAPIRCAKGGERDLGSRRGYSAELVTCRNY